MIEAAPPAWRPAVKASHTRLTALWRKAVAEASDTILPTEVEAAARAGDRPRLLAAIRPSVDTLVTTLAARLPAALLAALEGGATVAARTLPTPVSITVAARHAKPKAPPAVWTLLAARAWAAAHSDEFLDRLERDAELVLLTLVGLMFTGSGRLLPDTPLSPRRLASLVQGSVGLTQTQSGSLVSLAAALAEGEPGSIVKMSGARFRIPATGSTATFIDTATATVAGRQRAARGDTIAVHETMQAVTEGQRQVWAVAEESGMFGTRPGDDGPLKILVLGANPCPVCIGIATEGPIPMAASWSRPGPPFHISCQCVEDRA